MLHRVIAAQLCLALSGEALAQAPALRGPAISGRVIDAFDGRPLAHAIVEVIPRDSSTPLRRQSAESGSDGVYVIRGLERATFRLVIRKLGYRPSTITVTIVDSLNSEVSIGLEVAPVLLQPTRIVSERQRDFMLLAATDSIRATTRLDETRTRRNHFLGTDVREITAADVVEGVTLGEPDLFRSLHRLPGVTAAEDYRRSSGPEARAGTSPGSASTASRFTVRCTALASSRSSRWTWSGRRRSFPAFPRWDRPKERRESWICARAPAPRALRRADPPSCHCSAFGPPSSVPRTTARPRGC
jgi:hypothetical protein